MQPIERHVRVCPQHRVPIQEDAHGRLLCPKGWHPIGKFLVVDRLKGLVVSADAEKEGMSEMSNERSAIAAVPKAATKKLEVLDAAKYIDPAGVVLFIHLRRERTARSGDVYTVKWTRQAPGAKAENGTLARETFAERCREQFAAAKKQAVTDGWSEAPLQGHVPKFAPLPKPAAKKGR